MKERSSKFQEPISAWKLILTQPWWLPFSLESALRPVIRSGWYASYQKVFLSNEARDPTPHTRLARSAPGQVAGSVITLVSGRKWKRGAEAEREGIPQLQIPQVPRIASGSFVSHLTLRHFLLALLTQVGALSVLHLIGLQV